MSDVGAFGITIISMFIGMITTAILTWASDKLYNSPNKAVRKIARFVYELMEEIQWIVMFFISVFIALILIGLLLWKGYK